MWGFQACMTPPGCGLCRSAMHGLSCSCIPAQPCRPGASSLLHASELACKLTRSCPRTPCSRLISLQVPAMQSTFSCAAPAQMAEDNKPEFRARLPYLQCPILCFLQATSSRSRKGLRVSIDLGWGCSIEISPSRPACSLLALQQALHCRQRLSSLHVACILPLVL